MNFDSSPLPTEWKVKWKTPVDGLGHSSPVVWGDRLFVATAVNSAGQAPIKLGLYGDRTAAEETAEQAWKIFCFDKRTGKMLWEQTAHQAVPRTQRHLKATQANTTIDADGNMTDPRVLVRRKGGEVDYILTVIVHDMQDYDDYSKTLLLASAAVLRFQSNVVIEGLRVGLEIAI